MTELKTELKNPSADDIFGPSSESSDSEGFANARRRIRAAPKGGKVGKGLAGKGRAGNGKSKSGVKGDALKGAVKGKGIAKGKVRGVVKGKAGKGGKGKVVVNPSAKRRPGGSTGSSMMRGAAQSMARVARILDSRRCAGRGSGFPAQ